MCVLLQILNGERPQLPDSASISPSFPEADRLMALIRSCWAHEPTERPPMSEVADRLSKILTDVRARQKRAVDEEKLAARRRKTPAGTAA